MPSAPLLDIDELVQPIPGDEPAGVSPPFTLKQELEEARKEDNPEDYDENDPRRPAQAKRAEWPQILNKTRNALKVTSKDLMLAARLTEALTRMHGFGGFRDGFRLMGRLVSECWNRIHPSIEDGDLEVRAAPFNWLDDPDRGARFPTTLRMVPVLFGSDASFSLFDFRQMQEGKGSVKKEDTERAMLATPRETCQELADDLVESLQELDAIREVLDAKLGNESPGLTALRAALLECQNFVDLVLQKKGPAPSDAAEEEGEEGADAPGADGAPAESRKSRVVTRDSLYEQLQTIAGQLQQMEPHSPIPYLITKAIELGAMPFPLLMRAIIRDDNVLMEMNRELGIKEEPPPE